MRIQPVRDQSVRGQSVRVSLLAVPFARVLVCGVSSL